MRLVLQRVKSAHIKVDGQTVGSINAGWLVFLGVCPSDNQRDVETAKDKTIHLRMFSDDDGRFNKSLIDVGGDVLVVSQFTLFGDCRKGRRPSFTDAAKPEQAEQLYEAYVDALRQVPNLKVATGVFQANMDVALVNEGPVTMLIDTKRNF